MKAITVRQPWASLIAHGVKTIETRSWSTKYRGPLAIHAGKGIPRLDEASEAWDEMHRLDHGCYEATRSTENTTRFPPDSQETSPLPLGAVVATCTLADVVPIVGRWPTIHDPRSLYNGEHGLVIPGLPGKNNPIECADQRPFGDFTPGRHAWLLTDIAPCDPAPAKGRLGLWDLDLEELDCG